MVGGTITESVTTLYTGGPHTSEDMLEPVVNQDTGNVTLTWNSIEGGTYKVEASTNLTSWTTLSSSILAASSNTVTSMVDSGAALPTRYKSRFYRVSRTATAAFSAAYDGQ